MQALHLRRLQSSPIAPLPGIGPGHSEDFRIGEYGIFTVCFARFDRKGQLAENAIFRQVHLDRCTIDLTNTKEWSARTVHLNADSIAALESIRLKGRSPAIQSSSLKAHVSILVPGFCRALLTPASKAMCGTRIDIPFAHSSMAGSHHQSNPGACRAQTITMSARYNHLSPEHRLSVIYRIARQPPRKRMVRKIETNSHQIKTATSNERPFVL
ncbi:hypothetical protein EDE15_1281 [Edaphobacter aggregans]|uniref:Uncharacterized protein n=1 Tax=Edaphobacter aggregans TaxID=570835 RepID=A0A428MFW7_9BACT|nr:hypothetical protein EDE15_1281 [Edaphobacter aggregans]